MVIVQSSRIACCRGNSSPLPSSGESIKSEKLKKIEKKSNQHSTAHGVYLIVVRPQRMCVILACMSSLILYTRMIADGHPLRYTYMYTNVYMYIHIYIYVYINVYINYIYVYINVYINLCIHKWSNWVGRST